MMKMRGGTAISLISPMWVAALDPALSDDRRAAAAMGVPWQLLRDMAEPSVAIWCPDGTRVEAWADDDLAAE